MAARGRRRRVVAASLAGILLAATPAFGQTNWGLAVVGGDIVFADLNRGQISRLSADGRRAVLVDDVHCHSLAADYTGVVYAESVGTGSGGTGDVVALWRIAPGQPPALAAGPLATPEPGMWIARDASGASYSWHREESRLSRIFRRSADGAVSVLAGGAWGARDGQGTHAQLGEVGALAATASGTVYFTDSGQLRKVTPDGVVTTLARNIVSARVGGLPNGTGLFNRTVGLAVGPDETVYLADVYNLRVVRWDASRGADVVRDGNSWWARLTGGGLAWRPLGVAVDGANLYVLESMTIPDALSSLAGTPRIARIGSDGRVERVATIANRPLQALALLLPVVAVLGIVLLRRSRRLRKSTITQPQQSSLDTRQ